MKITKIIVAFSAALLATCCEGWRFEPYVSTDSLLNRKISPFLEQACYKNPTLKSLFSFRRKNRKKFFLDCAATMIETPHSGISELITKYNEKVSRYNYVKLIAKTYSEASCHNLVGQQLRLEAGLFVMEIIENSL